MSDRSDEPLADVASSIADRRPVAWDEAHRKTPDLGGRLDQLAAIERVAAAFETAGDRAEAEAPPVLFPWGSLEVIEPLGEGRFGEVYRARDPELGRQVALKLRRDDRHLDRGRWLAEGRRLARVQHPNVVTVHGAAIHDGRAGIWTDLIDGETLEERLARDGPLGTEELVAVGTTLCRALAAVHAAGLVHGDVKASNVIRERGGRLVLVDFGCSSAADEEAKPTEGTPLAMAPELLAGGLATPASDLYALGTLLYRLASGRYPRQATDLAELQRTGVQPEPLADLRPTLPPPLVRVIERSLAPDAGGRFGTAGEMERRLLDELESRTPARPRRRRTARWLYLLAGVVLAGLFALRPSGPDRAGAAPPRVEASLWLDGPSGATPLDSGDRIRLGDRLFLQVTPGEEIHLHVLNEDEVGALFILFPLPGVEPKNPLSAEVTHRLPGEVDGEPQDWQVTSRGGSERFLLVASRGPSTPLEAVLGELERARRGGPPASGREGLLRGVGGLAPAPPGRHGGLEAIRRRLAEAPSREAHWVELLHLDNPR